MEGVKFFWQVERDGLVFERKVTPTFKAQEGYNFVYDAKYRPLLDPPKPEQSKFDQILQWAEGQVAVK